MAITRISQSTVKEGLEKFNSFYGGASFVFGDYESIATITAGSGGVQSLVFTSIPTGYQHLQIRAVLRSTYGIDQPALSIQLNGTQIDRNHGLYGGGSSASAYSGTSGYISHTNGNTAPASMFSAIIIDILDYTSTTKNKVVRAFSGGDRNGSGFVEMTSGLEITTSVVSSVGIWEPDTSYKIAQHSTAALYGVKAP